MDRPVVTKNPEGKTVPAPATANFTCAGRGYGNVTVRWIRGRGIAGKAIVTNVNIPGGITSTLTVPNVEGRDEGNYRCRFTNSGGSRDSNRAQLIIGGEIIVHLVL